MTWPAIGDYALIGNCRTAALQPPGFLALNYGYRTPLAVLAAQAVYGAILGATQPGK